MREMHDSLRRPGEIIGVEDDERGRLVIHIDDQADQPAIILGTALAARDEDELAGMATRAEIMDGGRARSKVMLEQPRFGQRPFDILAIGQRDTVGVAIVFVVNRSS